MRGQKIIGFGERRSFIISWQTVADERNILRASFHQITSNYVLSLVFLLAPLLTVSTWHLLTIIHLNAIIRFAIRLTSFSLSIYIHCGALALFYQKVTKVNGKLRMFNRFVRKYFRLYISALIGLVAFSFFFFLPFFFFVSRMNWEIIGDNFEALTIFFVMRQIAILILGMLMTYLTAFVFVKKQGIDAFINGIKYLLTNFKKSTPLLLLNAIGCVIVSVIRYIAMQHPTGSPSYLFIVSFASILTAYINLAIYVGACLILTNDN